MRQYIITEAEANMVLAYLARQKYEDVFQLINMIQQVVAKREHVQSGVPVESLPAIEPVIPVEASVEEAPTEMEASVNN